VPAPGSRPAPQTARPVAHQAPSTSQALAHFAAQGWQLAVDIPDGSAVTLVRAGAGASAGGGAQPLAARAPQPLSAKALSALAALPFVAAATNDNRWSPLAAGAAEVPTCPSRPAFAFVPDAGGAPTREMLPYGVAAVQARDPVVVAAAAKARDAILFCIVDSGVDATHPDLGPLSPNIVSGWRDGSYAWGADSTGHGTHVTGTIGAAGDGGGVVGVISSGARIYALNVFGASDTIEETDVIAAWAACAAELKVLQRTNPNAKAVINMSLGGEGPMLGPVQATINALVAAGDILVFAAAGNSGGTTVSYPAGYDHVVSVAAVDDRLELAPFSQRNADVELAAPGVNILSAAAAADLSRALTPGALPPASVEPPLLGPDPEPKPSLFAGSGTGTVAGPLINCGSGFAPCAGAQGAVCLIQRGVNYFCEKVRNCAAGGGVGALVYNNVGPCRPLDTVTLVAAEVCGAVEFPPTVGLTQEQGEVLAAALAAGTKVTATIRGDNDLPPYAIKSGTSMASPHAVAVAGVVWAEHPECSGDEIVGALRASALDLGAPGRDSSFGYGLVQARGALDYLAANPCAARPPAAAPPPEEAASPPPAPLRRSQPSLRRPPPPRRRPPPPRASGSKVPARRPSPRPRPPPKKQSG
jgi:serine protease